MNQPPIELILISGFLGSGKTTFMKSLIANCPAKKLGVIVNEFGSIGIDGSLVGISGVQLVEINDGSVFCACLKDGFARTLKAFSAQPINTLLIECSGMADPSSMNTLLNGLSPYLQRSFEYKGCVCLVDCTTFLEYIDVLLPLQSQVAAADFIIANKTDLVQQETVEEIDRFIRALNADAPLHHTIYAYVPADLLAQQLTSHGYSADSSNTPYNRPSVYVLSAGDVCQKVELESFYAEISEKMLRVKGFLKAPNGHWWHIEGVAGQFDVTCAELDVEDIQLLGEGHLVLIAANHEDISAAIQNAWQRHCSGSMALKAT